MSFTDTVDPIEPLSRKPVAERVATSLLELIRSGNLKAGDKLPTEQELGAVMQVSRPVVREALRSLSIMGVVESRQGGRCYITDLTPARLLGPVQFLLALDESNVDAFYEARVVIESEILRAGLKRVTAADIETLRKLVKAGSEVFDNPVGFRVLDGEFQKKLMSLAGNPFLERIGQSLYEIGMGYRRVSSQLNGVIELTLREHDAIVDALEEGDADKVVMALTTHMNSIRATTYEAMRELAKERGG